MQFLTRARGSTSPLKPGAFNSSHGLTGLNVCSPNVYKSDYWIKRVQLQRVQTHLASAASRRAVEEGAEDLAADAASASRSARSVSCCSISFTLDRSRVTSSFFARASRRVRVLGA